MLKAGGVAPRAIGHVDHGEMLQPFFSHTGAGLRLSVAGPRKIHSFTILCACDVIPT